MPIFSYKAYDKDGHVIQDEIEAENIAVARKVLNESKFHVASIGLQSKSISDYLRFGKGKVGLGEMEFLTSELSILLNSGVKIDKGLAIVSRSKSGTAVGKLVQEVNKNLKSGKPVSEAFDTTEKVFDPLYLNLLSIGEKTGQLPKVFTGLANDLKFKKALKSKVLQATTYPMIIFFVCIACLSFVLNFIVPQMGSIFSESDAIPIYTQVLLATSDWMVRYQGYLGLIFAILAFWVFRNRKSKTFQNTLSKYVLGVPIVRELVVQVERIRFNSAMALMLDAGVKIDIAIDSAAKNISNQIIRKSLNVANEKIKRGARVSESLFMTPIFPSFYVSLLEVGEESGDLQRIFHEIAQRSKNDFENWTDKVTSILEPILILVMGGIVGSVVITMLLSVVSVNDIGI